MGARLKGGLKSSLTLRLIRDTGKDDVASLDNDLTKALARSDRPPITPEQLCVNTPAGGNLRGGWSGS